MMTETSRLGCKILDESTGELIAAGAVCTIALDPNGGLSAWSGRFDYLPKGVEHRLRPGGYTLHLEDGRRGSIIYAASMTDPYLEAGARGSTFQGNGTLGF
jgi:hypothetical protein